MTDSHFDAVVVGSGFGGSVMAYRLQQAGFHVCLLERGKKYPPGDFPRSPYQMKRNVWDPSEGYYGLYNIWAFPGLGAIVSSGLGGGSLIYANVLLPKDEKWFVKEDIHHGGYEYWPVTREDLDPHYEAVQDMLTPQPYPFERPPYNATAKTKALQQAAERLGLPWEPAPLAITFAREGEAPGEPIRDDPANNMYGRTRYTCRLCGECDIGCNYGSKNTLDYTYLSAAKRKGAEIWSSCEVRSFEPHTKGYAIHYVQHHPEWEGQTTATHDPSVLPLHTITADWLILSAGALGTPYLLLKNRSAFPHISRQLGTRFCGNGDFLTFASRCSDNTTGTAKPLIVDGSHGPVITSYIRFADQADQIEGGAGRGFYIQDGGYPDSLNWMLQVLDMPSALAGWWHVATRLLKMQIKGEPETDIGGDVARLFGACGLSSRLLPLLGIGRDIPNGRMALRHNKLDLDWNLKASDPYFRRVRDNMEHLAAALGADFVDDPLWYIGRVITVHPVGGCPMGRNDTEGVVNSRGQVFHYPHLYIADGSVMPGPVGTNPSLTIAALADRFADHIIKTRGEGT